MAVLSVSRLCSYNPLSCRAVGRWDDIASQLRSCHAIGLQGTQCETDLPVEVFGIGGHNFFHWGRAPGKKGRPTGVALALDKKQFPKSAVRQILEPPKALKGRLGGVRLRTTVRDVAFIVGYAPCHPTTPSAAKQCDMFRKTL